MANILQSNRQGLEWTIRQWTLKGYRPVCKKAQDVGRMVAVCLERSIPSIKGPRKPVPAKCVLCTLDLTNLQYSGHAARCILTYQSVLHEILLGGSVGDNAEVRVAATVSSTVPPARSRVVTNSRSTGRKSTPKASAGEPLRRSVGTQTEKPIRTTANACTMTRKIELVPGGFANFVKWKNANEAWDLIDTLTIDDVSAEPLQPSLEMHACTDVNVDAPTEKGKINSEELLAELDPLHPSKEQEEIGEIAEIVPSNADGDEVNRSTEQDDLLDIETVEESAEGSDTGSENNEALSYCTEEPAADGNGSEESPNENESLDSVIADDSGMEQCESKEGDENNLGNCANELDADSGEDNGMFDERNAPEPVNASRVDTTSQGLTVDEGIIEGNDGKIKDSPYWRLIRRGAGRGRQGRPAYRSYK